MTLLQKVQGRPRAWIKQGSYALARSLAALTAPRETIFILSHMRSGSSLLAHILIANPEVIGYGETMTRYTTSRDFDLLALKIWWMLRRWPFQGRERFLLDKLLHNVLLAPSDMRLLVQHQTKLVFLLREPSGCLASLVRSMQYSPEQAVQYYLDRLDMLTQYANYLPSDYPSAMLTYQDLLQHTEPALKLLSTYLELRTPVSEEYDLLPTTGRYGIGDFSSNIRAGKIIRQKSPPSQTGADIPPNVLEQACSAYERTYSILASRCKTP
jgi:hypothetical protein